MDGTICVWDVSTGRSLTTLHEHVGTLYAVALSGDGHVLASGGTDGLVRVWHVGRDQQLVTTLRGHVGAVWNVAPSDDGQLLISGGDDGTTRLWNTGSGACLHVLRTDRRYERMDITGLSGVTDAQRVTLFALGASETRSA